MRHRIHFDGALAAGSEVEVTGEEFHHAVRVARVREGEEVELFDGKGKLAAARIASIGGSSARVVVERELPGRESKLEITLAMAIINLDKFELVLQKATELGVRTVIPMVTDRVEIRPERYRGKGERWQKIVFEAVKQSGRAVMPAIEPPSTFDEVIARDGVRILFDADAASDQWQSSLVAVTVMIGPEGGWSETELRSARERGCTFQRLGPRRMRAETAAITATAVLAARYGDI